MPQHAYPPQRTTHRMHGVRRTAEFPGTGGWRKSQFPHTCVEHRQLLGTGGKAWSCRGGKTCGTAFNSGTGSTYCIAQPNERAGITCYLVNGVCHQAARFVVNEYANLLTREELQAYFGLEESEQPTLPIDQL